MRTAAPTSDEAEVLELDRAWNDAYRRHERTGLANILADDFTGFDTSGAPFTKAMLMADPPERARAIEFGERAILVFGDAAISRGRLMLELADRRIDQRFLRVFARRDGAWRAVSVAVTPVAP